MEPGLGHAALIGSGKARATMKDASETAEEARQDSGTGRRLTPAAQRALAEAEERRRARQAKAAEARPKELNGRQGPEPVRYGDWEKNGLISDF